MGFGGIRLCLSLLLAFAVISSASTNTIDSFSVSENDEMVMTMGARSLKVRINDYEDPTANRGHDPPSVSKAKPRRVRSRKG
ncbi:protein PSY3-like [Argentina anserina]|uniref:protein PSY3-like n=1 Tax=Argentina anserina TaxID=57926 RepID=UPI0021764C5C|nr:protein PSY3-like [Potentilla anserina]